MALGDLVLGFVILGIAMARLGTTLIAGRFALFRLGLYLAVIILYALMLFFSSLIFWNPNFVFEWLFNSLWQMGRYPMGIYPGWLRLVLTWVVPVGLMTSVPASALAGTLPPGTLAGAALLVVALLALANVLFRVGLRRYSSASS